MASVTQFPQASETPLVCESSASQESYVCIGGISLVVAYEGITTIDPVFPDWAGVFVLQDSVVRGSLTPLASLSGERNHSLKSIVSTASHEMSLSDGKRRAEESTVTA